MDTNAIFKSLSLEEKISQMFIMGFHGTALNEQNKCIQSAIQSGLGGIILFSENIESYGQIACLTSKLQSTARIPLFMSIDQEGGRVERTINVKDKVNYLSPKELADTGNPDSTHKQAETMAKELINMGINMNYAPVLDVNTNPNNPIIGVRSFGDNPATVTEYASQVYNTFLNNNIIPVVKHFPGHGDTGEDSHLTMPQVNLDIDELENTHIKPFIDAFNAGVQAVMVSHVHYTAFDEEILPASLSSNVIKHHLRERMGFNGVVISDDMVMGGIKNYYNTLESCLKGIEAGIDLFIFRNCDAGMLNLIHKLVACVENGLLSKERVEESVWRILNCKSSLITQ